MSIVLGKNLHMKIILPNVDTEFNCNHDIKEKIFLSPQRKLIMLLHVSMTSYKLFLWLDPLPWYNYLGNLYSTFKISSNITPSMELPWAQVRIDLFLCYTIIEVHLLVYISCLSNSEPPESKNSSQFLCLYYWYQ